jgi:hypothetical protein
MVGQAFIQQGLHGLTVQVHALGLEEGAFVPGEAQPSEAIDNVLGVFGARSLQISIFNAQNKLTVVVAGKQPVKDGCAGGTNVEIACGAGRNANSNCHEIFLDHHRDCSLTLSQSQCLTLRNLTVRGGLGTSTMLLDVRVILLGIGANSLHWPPKSPNSGGLLMLNSTKLEAEFNDE